MPLRATVRQYRAAEMYEQWLAEAEAASCVLRLCSPIESYSLVNAQVDMEQQWVAGLEAHGWVEVRSQILLEQWESRHYCYPVVSGLCMHSGHSIAA